MFRKVVQVDDIVARELEYVERFLNGYNFVDPRSGFEFNFAGMSSFELKTALVNYRLQIAKAILEINKIESGEIMNYSAVKAESENRAVDHYNLRLGEGLKKSLEYWDDVKLSIGQITSGKLKAENGKTYTDIIINGIGGSVLGPLMMLIYQLGIDYNFSKDKTVRLFFVSNTDPKSFSQVMQKVDLSRTIMVNISKSGGTAETAGNMEAFNQLVTQKDLNIGKHNIAVTTPGSKFDQYSQKNNFLFTFYMNEATGGRTSIGSAVGMVPAAFSNFDFADFLRGQAYMDEMTRKADPKENPAMLFALVIHDLFVQIGPKNLIGLGYSDAMREVVHYLQQLFMESLGKEYDREGNTVKTGLTIFGGVGTGEQHAFMQQVQKALEDCFVMIMSFRKRNYDYPNIKAVSMGRQLLNFVNGTEEALRTNQKEYVDLVFEKDNLFNLGMLVAFMERVVTILGAFWGINPYDQPGVQDGKKSSDKSAEMSKKLEQIILDIGKIQEVRSEVFIAAIKDKYGEDYSSKLPAIEKILADIEANINVQNSYPLLSGKLNISRRWDGKRWRYTINRI